ncbi:MAG: hypothetical protein ABID79_06370 [Elusimicrobiota bacterium]
MKNTKILILTLISILIFFSNVIFTDKMFYFRDICNLFMPYRLFAAENIVKLQDISDDKKYLVTLDVRSEVCNYYNFKNFLPANTNIPHHIYNASGYDPLTTGKIEDFVEKLGKNPDAEKLAKYGIKYVITSRNMNTNWKKITKNLYENKISFPENVVVNPQNFQPKYIIFLTGLLLTIFSMTILIKRIASSKPI